jgi:hypothetical protein
MPGRYFKIKYPLMRLQYSRGYKNRAISEKMFGTLAIFYDSLKGYFCTFFFFFVIRGQLICI